MWLTALDDFGNDDDNYVEALSVLLDSYRSEADFTELGSKMSRFFLRNALVARLLSEASWKQYPEHVDVPINAPIFVTGLPRTGTTALHRLYPAASSASLSFGETALNPPAICAERWHVNIRADARQSSEVDFIIG
mgnify:CR=1 FL=1